jgi:hypothetical protein
MSVVTPAGFKPAISTLKGSPLRHCRRRLPGLLPPTVATDRLSGGPERLVRDRRVPSHHPLRLPPTEGHHDRAREPPGRAPWSPRGGADRGSGSPAGRRPGAPTAEWKTTLAFRPRIAAPEILTFGAATHLLRSDDGRPGSCARPRHSSQSRAPLARRPRSTTSSRRPGPPPRAGFPLEPQALAPYLLNVTIRRLIYSRR